MELQEIQHPSALLNGSSANSQHSPLSLHAHSIKDNQGLTIRMKKRVIFQNVFTTGYLSTLNSNLLVIQFAIIKVVVFFLLVHI